MSRDKDCSTVEYKGTTTFNFEYQRRVLIDYLKTKLEHGDWHAVADAACDLRVMDAEQKTRAELERKER